MSNEDWDRGKDLTAITQEAYRLASDREKLVARAPAPQFTAAVEHAERQIGIDPHDPKRPVYAYIGDLHAHLGQVGLVFERAWANRCLHGFTRCDSGGMVGGFGNFEYAVEPNEPWAAAKNRLWAAQKSVKDIDAEIGLLEKESMISHAALPKLADAKGRRAIAQENLERVQAADDPKVSARAKATADTAQAARDLAVRSITVLKDRVPGVRDLMNDAFRTEVTQSYGGARGYVFSKKPEVRGWDAEYRRLSDGANTSWDDRLTLEEQELGDPRERCVEVVDFDRKRHDRRIWTWEVRMTESPDARELFAVILSEEASKVFNNERLEHIFEEEDIAASVQSKPSAPGEVSVQLVPPPRPSLDRVKIITSKPDPDTQKNSGLEEHTGGAPWFYSNEAREALLGSP